MEHNQGDIVLVDFPFSNHQDSKPRPVAIVSNYDVNNTDDVIIAAITSTIRNDDFSFELTDSDVTRSLGKPCEIRCHKLTTCEQSKILRSISAIKPDTLKEVLKKVRSQFTFT